MSIDQHIEELRAELANVTDPVERGQIEAELDLARAELAVLTAEKAGETDAEPPF